MFSTCTHKLYIQSWEKCVLHVCVSANATQTRLVYLDECQRLLPAADQCGFLLLLLLHDGGKGHQGAGGRAAHCSEHPGPEGKHEWHRERQRMGISACCCDRESKKSLSEWTKVESTTTDKLLCVNGRLSTWLSQTSYMTAKLKLKYNSIIQSGLHQNHSTETSLIKF